MNQDLQKADEAMKTSVTASFLGTVRHAVFATAVALPMAMLAGGECFESDADCASAGELWLEVQSKMTVATERIT